MARMSRLRCLATALLAFVGFVAVAPAGPPVGPLDGPSVPTGLDRFRPHQRCAHPAPPTTAFEPFDLTYLPRPASEVQALIAIRPAALFDHPDAGRHADAINHYLGGLARSVAGVRQGGPGLEALDSLILCGWVVVTPNEDPATKADRPTNLNIGADTFVARTRAAFDWGAAVRRWFPETAPAGYQGASYQTLPYGRMRITQMLPPESRPRPDDLLAFYASDDRTLVVGNKVLINDLIDRVRAGNKLPPPYGWERVNRSLLAVAVDNRDKKWVRNIADPPGPYVPDPALELYAAADHFAVGLDAGPTTRLRVVALCPHQFAAKKARAARNKAFTRILDMLVPLPWEPKTPAEQGLADILDPLMTKGTVTPTPLGFEYNGEAAGDLIRAIVRHAEEPPKAAK